MKTSDKKKVVLRVMCVFLVMTFVMPWTIVDNIVTPDGSALSRPVWGPYLFYKEPPPQHLKEILWVWTGVQALVVLLVGGGASVFLSARAGTSQNTHETSPPTPEDEH